MSRFTNNLRSALWALALCIVALYVQPAAAQSNGGFPQANLIKGPDGCFYGTASFRGPFGNANGGQGYGTVFKVSPTGVFKVLHAFRQFDGAYPYGGLTLGADGAMYGTTGNGGDFGMGTLYRIRTDGAFTMLHSFTWLEGAQPYAGVTMDGAMNIYGTTVYGGEFGMGTIYKRSPNGVISIIHDFNGSDGLYPWNRMTLQPDGLYGTTLFGGPGATSDNLQYGTIFKVTTSGQFMNLYTFNGTDGNGPVCTPALGSDGCFYGTTEKGGDFNLGMAFRMTKTGILANIHSFTPADGWYPEGTLVRNPSLDDGFYGATVNSGSDGYPGTIFKIGYDGSVQTLHTFTNLDGWLSVGGLTMSSGKLWGTGFQGGANGFGTIFTLQPQTKVQPAPTSFTKLFDF